MGDVKPLSRRDRAAATRRAIVEAATRELTEGGYHATTMASIARRAGVATQTVYFVFHTKAAVLTAAIDAAVLGGGTPPERTGWWAEATTTNDGRRALELFVTGTAEILVRAAVLTHVARTAVGTDPEVSQVLEHHERLREIGYRTFIDGLSAKNLLQAGVTPEEATDALLTLAGPGVFLDLTRERGWDAARFAKWASRALALLLLQPA